MIILACIDIPGAFSPQWRLPRVLVARTRHTNLSVIATGGKKSPRPISVTRLSEYLRNLSGRQTRNRPPAYHVAPTTNAKDDRIKKGGRGKKSTFPSLLANQAPQTRIGPDEFLIEDF